MQKSKSTLVSNLKKATIEMLLLKFLSEEDMYGYQIVQEFRSRSNGLYTLLEGSMYPILYRLSDQHYITSYEKKVSVRQTRIYYHIEKEGYEYIKQLMSSYFSSLDIIDFLISSNKGDSYETKENEGEKGSESSGQSVSQADTP
jgi:PadR family transcriptional regulator PadR